MAISDKLTYLNTTKGKIKDAINLAGANITDDTFRSYPDKLKEAYVDIINNGTDELYSNFPKVSQTGEEIALNGTYNAPMVLSPKGNTEQTTYTGKNLFDKTGSVYNWLIKNDTQVITSNSNEKCVIINVKPNTTYTISKIATNRLRVGEYPTFPEVGITLNNYQINDTGTTLTTTTLSTTNYLVIEIVNVSNETYNLQDTLDSLQVETGSIATSYEPYCGATPSPNPDYPQDIKVVKGNNTINVSGKNLFDKDSGFINAYIDASGVIHDNANANALFNTYIKVQPNTTYIFSCNNLIKNLGINEFDNSKTFILRTLNNNSSSVSITTTNTTNYLRLQLNYDSSTNVTQTIIDNLQLMFELGNTRTTYQAYTSTDYSVNLGSMELCKIGDYQDYIYKDEDKWYKKAHIGKVVLEECYSSVTNPSGETTYQTTFTQTSNMLTQNWGYGYSNYFIRGTTKTNDIIRFGANNKNLYVYTNNINFADKTSADAWLNTNKPIVYYILATPTTTEITDTDLINQLEAFTKANSIDDKTFISQTNADLPFIINASALSKN